MMGGAGFSIEVLWKSTANPSAESNLVYCRDTLGTQVAANNIFFAVTNNTTLKITVGATIRSAGS